MLAVAHMRVQATRTWPGGAEYHTLPGVQLVLRDTYIGTCSMYIHRAYFQPFVLYNIKVYILKANYIVYTIYIYVYTLYLSL